ncbi:DUF4365 domain-containing protein [Luteimonas sp. RD2P54]|uniref:DUF4365 domain-containing protein n=1 Tax=Luteimonas endophytica TaxID=3042023 RepID=A0ABT6JBK2_9GAMM|nr:DUF4365 domain-containing protein [Luteimonas endophytica]MDH5824199.1 DUF4365 domain-containing protein [Luteimonas endophytica]
MAPNFPENQQTGAVTEDEVSLLFMKWGWTVGRDRLDTGYDLCVEPETSHYGGARFLVQVKGTTQKRKSASLVAPVGRARLRQYVRNPHPVFLVRATPDGHLYWIHVQQWAKTNSHRLSGEGVAHVRMSSDYTLADRDQFEVYLQQVLSPPSSRPGALGTLAEERANYLNALDPRLRVRVNVRDGAEEHRLFANSENVEAHFSFQPRALPENLSRLDEALNFGLPRSIQVDNFQMSGSPMYTALGVDRPHTGTLTIEAEPRPAWVRIYPGREYSITAQELALPADFYLGRTGIAVSNEARNNVFRIDVRLEALNGGLAGGSTLFICEKRLTAAPIQQFKELGDASEWADQAYQQKMMFFELAVDGKRSRLWPQEVSNEMLGWLHHIKLLARIHAIARFLNLDYSLPFGYQISQEEANEIEFAYELLRGHRVSGGSVSILIEDAASLAPSKTPQGLVATTNIVMTLSGQDFGILPVEIDMPGYVIERIPDTNNFRVHHPEAADAWVIYKPDAPMDGLIRRKPA